MSVSCKRRAKKKVTLSADDNIISDDPDAALELAKSISQTEAEEAEATRKVHDTHARIKTESVSKSAKKKSGGRSSKSVVILDTLSTPNSKPATSKTKLKGVPSLTPEEQEATDIMHGKYGILISEVNMAYLELRIRSIESIAWIRRIHRNGYGILVKIALDGDDDVLDVLSFGSKVQCEEVLVSGGPIRRIHFLDTAYPFHGYSSWERGISMKDLKESKKTNRRQPGIVGSNEGIGSIPGVHDESTFVSTTSSEGTDDDDDVEKDGKDGDVDDEGDDHVSDTQDADDEDVETELDDDDIYKYKIRVCKDEDEEMKDAEVEESDKGDEDITDAAKEEPEKILEAKDDAKKTELPPSSSSLFVSSGFGDQLLKLSSDSSLVSTVKDSADIDKVPVSVIPETTVLPHIPKIITETPVSTSVSSSHVTPIISSVQQTTTPILTPPTTTDAPTVTTAIPESNALSTVELRVAKLEKDMFELKTVDHSSEALTVLQSYVPTVVDSYLDSKVGDVFQKELQKHTADLIHKYSLQYLPELTKKPTPIAEQESEKSPLYILKIKKEQAGKQKMLKFTIKSTEKAALEEYDLKSTLYQSMNANKLFNRNPANHRLYHALMEALIEDENAMDKGVADTVKDHKRKHDDDEDDDDEDPPVGPNQGKKTKRIRTKEFESIKKPSTTKETPKGKTPTKGSQTGKAALAKELVEEPITEVIMDDAGDDVVRDDDQPQAASKPKTSKTPNLEWFKQPPRPPTPDPE
ncbi:hypothetical protein Tco_0752398 [Tanacetum coccineum]|uniref:Uncharacterized protein n=1 Tax=Tanacetum coccineum TaxID=301880 RepID=A0ABQ4ZA28_9ASTR